MQQRPRVRQLTAQVIDSYRGAHQTLHPKRLNWALHADRIRACPWVMVDRPATGVVLFNLWFINRRRLGLTVRVTLSDPSGEEALHDVPLFRDFAGLG